MTQRHAASDLVQVGVIGAGAFAEACHVPGLLAHPQAKITAICGRNYARTRALAVRFGIPDVYTDYRELCAKGDIDAVTIVTPNAAHADQAVTAFLHGKHVLCEKPLGRTVSEAGMMLDAAIVSEKIHQVAFTFRYLFGVRELKRRILAGDIGTPYLLRVQYDGWWGLLPDWKVGWREQQDVAGGGVLHDYGSHLFDIARFLLGPIESVTGFLHWIPRKQPHSAHDLMIDVETDDIAAAWFRHTSGIRGQWFVSRATPRSTDNGWLEVTGPEGALRASLSRGTVDCLQASGPKQMSWEALPLPAAASDGKPHALTAMMCSFVDSCIKGHSNLEVDATFFDGAAAQQSIHGVILANDQSAWIPLSDRIGQPPPQVPLTSNSYSEVADSGGEIWKMVKRRE